MSPSRRWLSRLGGERCHLPERGPVVSGGDRREAQEAGEERLEIAAVEQRGLSD